MERTHGSGSSKSLLYAAPLLCLVLHWRSLHGWFQLDDFAWLGLRDLIGVNHTWIEVFFTPMAQGTVRPISERLFFIAFRSLFDLNALPYHALAFVTQVANLLLLSRLSRRLDPSGSAWIWAPLIWCSHSALAWPLAWAAAYNQILCGFVFLAGLALLDRALRSGRPRDEAAHWAVFVAGFGVLESNVVYPLLALGYAATGAAPRHRAITRRLWLMMIVSIAYAVLHTYYVSKPDSGPYRVAFGAGMVKTILTYAHCTIWPACSELEGGMRINWTSGLFAAGASGVMLMAAAYTWRRGRGFGPVTFGMWWWLCTVAPYLPLPEKVSLYYLSLPAIGFSIMAAQLIGTGIECPDARCRLRASLLLVAILPMACVNSLRLSAAYSEPSLRAKRLFGEVVQAARTHPGKLILLDGVSESNFWNSVYHHPFRLAGLDRVLLAPRSETRLRPAPARLNGYEDYILSHAAALSAVSAGQAVVFEVDGEERLVDTTARFLDRLARDPRALVLPRKVDVAKPWLAGLLDNRWHEAEGSFRWMPRSAGVRLRGSLGSGGKLIVTGFCSTAQAPGGPIQLRASIEGTPLDGVAVPSCGARQRLLWMIPDCFAGRGEIQVHLEASRAGPVGSDTRELGFGVETIEVEDGHE